MNTFTSQVITIRPKRHRRRYNDIRAHVRYVVQRRKEQEVAKLEHEACLRAQSIESITYMVLVKQTLGLPLTEEETQCNKPELFDLLPVDPRPNIVQTLKYMSADFTPDKLYHVWEKCWYGYPTIRAWFAVRWAIIEVVEGRQKYSTIPAVYYSFENGDFFFDPSRVINPEGQNFMTWKLLPAPKPVRPRQEFPPSTIYYEQPTLRDWWESIKKFLKARNPG
jgi:hypothetical protein